MIKQITEHVRINITGASLGDFYVVERLMPGNEWVAVKAFSQASDTCSSDATNFAWTVDRMARYASFS